MTERFRKKYIKVFEEEDMMREATSFAKGKLSNLIFTSSGNAISKSGIILFGENGYVLHEIILLIYWEGQF